MSNEFIHNNEHFTKGSGLEYKTFTIYIKENQKYKINAYNKNGEIVSHNNVVFTTSYPKFEDISNVISYYATLSQFVTP